MHNENNWQSVDHSRECATYLIFALSPGTPWSCCSGVTRSFEGSVRVSFYICILGMHYKLENACIFWEAFWILHFAGISSEQKKQAHLPTKTTALEHAKEHPKGTFHAQENPFTVLVMLCMQCANQPFVEVCHWQTWSMKPVRGIWRGICLKINFVLS